MNSLQQKFTHMYTELLRRGLQTFINEPGEANAMVLREFYANFPEHENSVRHKAVNASFEAIQIAYHLSPPVPEHDDFYEYGQNPRDVKWERFFDAICVPGKEVQRMQYGEKFHSSALSPEAKSWLYVVNSRLIPSKNPMKVNAP